MLEQKQQRKTIILVWRALLKVVFIPENRAAKNEKKEDKAKKQKERKQKSWQSKEDIMTL